MDYKSQEVLLKFGQNAAFASATSLSATDRAEGYSVNRVLLPLLP